MWNLVKKTFDFGDFILRKATTVLAAVLLVYSAYVLYDTLHTNNQALEDLNLLQYKPVLEEGSQQTFADLMAMNEDIVGWITFPDTKVDYPLVQGQDNLEYANKDVFGNYSLTGSLYLSSMADRDFRSRFSVIFGHFMDNGAMFGDLHRYKEPEYFKAHQDGYIITPTQIVRLHVFAVLETDAYDTRIYNEAAACEDPGKLEAFIRESAIQSDGEIDLYSGQVIAMSTCSSAVTNGRTVVFAKVTREALTTDGEDLDQVIQEKSGKADEAEEDESVPEIRVRQNTEGKWALLNLVCALLCVYCCVPLGRLKAKYGCSGIIRKANAASGTDLYRQKPTAVRILAGTLIQILTAAAAALLFLKTEDIHAHMIICDVWTRWMILMAWISSLSEVILCRYSAEKKTSVVQKNGED